jgi:NAD(P)H-nitrite reductase large subunit
MVNRCICHDAPFWAIAALAKQGKTFHEIQAATNCCRGCGTCEPYVRVVIKTGAVELPVLTATEQSAIMTEAWKLDAATGAPPPLPRFRGPKQR